MATLQGAETLRRRLAALQRAASGPRVASGVKAGAMIIRDEAQRLAPKDTGEGAENIVLGEAATSTSRAGVSVGYDADKAGHMIFAELGTRDRAAQPHLRPAFDGKKVAAVKALGVSFKAGIDSARRV